MAVQATRANEGTRRIQLISAVATETCRDEAFMPAKMLLSQVPVKAREGESTSGRSGKAWPDKGTES